MCKVFIFVDILDVQESFTRITNVYTKNVAAYSSRDTALNEFEKTCSKFVADLKSVNAEVSEWPSQTKDDTIAIREYSYQLDGKHFMQTYLMQELNVIDI